LKYIQVEIKMMALSRQIILAKLLLVIIMTKLSSGQRNVVPAILETESKFIYSIAFSSEGDLMATGDKDVVKIFTFRDRQLVGELKGGHTGDIMSIAFSSDNKWLVSGGKDGKMVLWDIQDQEKITTLTIQDCMILTVAVSSDNRFLAIGGTTGTVYLYSIYDEEIVKEFSLHDDDVLQVKFNPSVNNMLVSSGADRRLIFYDTDLMEKVDIKLDHKSWIRALDFNNEGTRLISGDDKGYLYTWGIEGLKQVRFIGKVKLSRSWITGVSFHDDNRSFVVSDITGRVIIRTPFSRLRTKARFPIHKVLMKPAESSWLIVVMATRGGGVIIRDGSDFKRYSL
jgi:WD40 repeat protein